VSARLTPKTLWNLVTLINSVAAKNNAILNSRNYFKFLPIRIAEQRLDRALKWIAVRLPQFAADGIKIAIFNSAKKCCQYWLRRVVEVPR
jgi:hypothetical protein